MSKVVGLWTALLSLVISAGAVFAQAAAPPAQPHTVPARTPEAQSTLEEVIVTATGTNISGIQPVGSEALNLSRREILDTGIADLHDVLRALPQIVDVSPAGVANYRLGGTAGYSANNTQGTAINLRGLGAQATLVLVDGHRVTPSGTVSVFTEADQVPIAALQRIEIIDDGNSAIYGSDAVGGVLNYVIRKDLEGVEVTGRGTFVAGYHGYGASVTGGHTWSSLGPLGKGNFILGVDYDWRGAMPASSRAFLTDVSPFGGYDNRIRGNSQGGTSGVINGGVGPGQPGNNATPGGLNDINWCDNYNAVAGSCRTGTYLYRGLPRGSGIPTYDQTSPAPSLGDRAAESDYIGRRWRYQLTAFYNQEINSRLSAFFEGFWTKRDVWTAGSQYYDQAVVPVTVNAGSPFYITPPGAAGGPMAVNYDFTAHGAPLWYTDNPDTNWTAITGIRAALWADWSANLSITVGRDRTCGICNIGTHVDVGALRHAVNVGAVNPLSSDPLTPEQLALFMGGNIQQSQMGIEDYVLRFDGPLFDLPGGALKGALGGEFQHNTEYVQNGANRTQIPAEGITEETPPPYEGVGCGAPRRCPPRTRPNEFAWDNISSAGRRITSVFLELYVPLIGTQNAIPLVRSLSLDAAGRLDHYSDVGGTTNPKIGLTWKVNPEVGLRTSWGTSFRAPSLTDTNPFVYSVKGFIAGLPNLTGDPAIDGIPIPGGKLTSVAFLLGDRPGIKPERARNWSAGLDLTPHWIPELRVSTTYYHIKYTDEIFGPPVLPAAITNPQTYQLYKPFVHPIHNPANCTPGDRATYDPALLPLLDAVGIYGTSISSTQACQIQAWVDGRVTNIGSMTQSGLDLNVAYDLDTALGHWSVNLNAVRVLKEDIAAVASLPETSVLGRINNLVRWRGRSSVGWRHGPLSATVFVNYVGSYLNNTPIVGRPNQTVPSWTTLDLTVGFDLGRLSNSGFLKDSAISVSAQNLFDRDPPIVLTSGGAQFDANNANVFGRIVQLNVMKRF
ncbi:MAG: TonB-dependent receptor plug domain-containing protein [Steroidobacteraceae bacterium]